MKSITISNRIPKDFFETTGAGESDIAVHAGSYHLALREAGIEMHNIIVYSSMLPGIARLISKPKTFIHGSVMETIMAVANSKKGVRATAGLIYGWLYDKNGEKYGGLVCEASGGESIAEIETSLRASLNELYENGYSEFTLKDIKVITRSFIPKKKYGTALIALAFVNHEIPVLI
jgi:arginine decarboxylase